MLTFIAPFLCFSRRKYEAALPCTAVTTGDPGSGGEVGRSGSPLCLHSLRALPRLPRSVRVARDDATGVAGTVVIDVVLGGPIFFRGGNYLKLLVLQVLCWIFVEDTNS